MRKISTLLIVALSFSLAIAQDEPPEETSVEEEVRRYKVEIIVFSYEEDVSIGSEVFLPDEPPVPADPLLEEDSYPVIDDEIDVAPIEEEAERQPVWVVDTDMVEDVLAEDENAQDLRFVLLREDELGLSEEIRKLELLDAYKTIMHVGWIQPTYPEEETPALELRLLGEPPPGLDGRLTLYLSRYLHLVVDLTLDAPSELEEVALDAAPSLSFGDSRTQYADDFATQPQPVRYRISENRIVKNGELRYFDHPKFGVLAKVMRVEEEQAEEEPMIPLIGAGSQ